MAARAGAARAFGRGARRAGRAGDRRRGLPRARCAGDSISEARRSLEVLLESEEPDLFVLVEVDGVMSDVHVAGHKEAFNRAFESLNAGTSWDTNLYNMLLRSGGGTPQGMLERYFTFYGYPSGLIADDSSTRMLPPEAQSQDMGLVRARADFVASVVRQKELEFEAIVREGLKLREGVTDFLRDCRDAGVPVILIPATASLPEEGVLDSVLRTLEAEGLGSAVEVAGRGLLPGTDGEDSPEGDGDGELSLEGELAKQLKKQKGELLAPEVGGDLRRQSYSSNVIIDSSLFSESRRSSLRGPALERLALALSPSRGVRACVLLGSSRSTCLTAKGIGLFNAVVRARGSGEFPGVAAVVDGFGFGGGVTLQRLKIQLNTWNKQFDPEN